MGEGRTQKKSYYSRYRSAQIEDLKFDVASIICPRFQEPHGPHPQKRQRREKERYINHQSQAVFTRETRIQLKKQILLEELRERRP